MQVGRARRFGRTVFRGAETVDIGEYLKSSLDVLNVFPVPDEDTWTNMLLTMRSEAAHSWHFEADAKVDAARVYVPGWVPSVRKAYSIENRLERLEAQFDELVKSTWSYLFSERDIKEMRELSKGMLEDSKKMRESAQQLQEVDDES